MTLTSIVDLLPILRISILYKQGLFDILPGIRARGNNRAVASRQVDISQAAANFAVFLCLPICLFFASVSPPATNIFLVN